MSKDVTRREAVGRIVKLCAAGVLTVGTYGLLSGRGTGEAVVRESGRPNHFKVAGASDKVVVAVSQESTPPETLVRQALEALGGMSRFVSRGDVVALKPNISWDRPPELAANTNPEVLSAVARLCFEAGAAKVNIVDHTINNPERVFKNCGAAAAAKATGAVLFHPDARFFKPMNLGGRRLNSWEVYTPVIEADKLINIPVAKHHGLTRATLGMKNWIGAVGGMRGALHQDIHQSIVDLATFFQPTLVIIDATRVMLHNGPSGGSLSDVAAMNTIIAGTDQVAVDAAALLLFGLSPEDVGYILLGEKQGLGRIDPGPDNLIRLNV